MTIYINDNGIDREATPDEAAAIQAAQTEAQTAQAAAGAAAAAKEATRAAALVKLGLTADEIAALFG